MKWGITITGVIIAALFAYIFYLRSNITELKSKNKNLDVRINILKQNTEIQKQISNKRRKIREQTRYKIKTMRKSPDSDIIRFLDNEFNKLRKNHNSSEKNETALTP